MREREEGALMALAWTGYHESPTPTKLVQKKKWLQRWCHEQFPQYVSNEGEDEEEEEQYASAEGALALVSLASSRGMALRRSAPGASMKRGRRAGECSSTATGEPECIPTDNQGHRWLRPPKRAKHGGHSGPEDKGVVVEDSVKQVLSTAGVAPEAIVSLLSQQKGREEVIEQTGFSSNYIMKLQRRVLRSSHVLQLRAPDVHTVGDFILHVLFDCDGVPLFIKKELCQILDMKGTTFSYWKKKAHASEMDTSQDFRLMDQCRSIFGGRSTYTLYTAQATNAILAKMESSRQHSTFKLLPRLVEVAAPYASLPATS